MKPLFKNTLRNFFSPMVRFYFSEDRTWQFRNSWRHLKLRQVQEDKQEEGAEAAQEVEGEPQEGAEKTQTNGQRKI